MSANRLLQHYRRLYQSQSGQDGVISLLQLAEQLHCTPRHMRNLLGRMQAQGWLDWQSQPGRGKRSRLRLLKTADELERNQAAQWLEQGRVEQAVAMLGDDPSQLAQVLLPRMGRQWRQDKQVLNVPYYRPLPDLLPGAPLRRSEKHLIGQIFNGLTRLNEEKGEIEADLAHHWEQRSDLEWHFHLRPAVRWHDGRLLGVADIAATFERLRAQPLFAHLGGIRQLAPHSLALHLSEADPWLPWLLADPAASILPADQAQREGFAARPIGTGPYRVAANDARRLSLEAFDDYFGYRALLDQVDIWIMPDWQADGAAPRNPCGLTVKINPEPVDEITEMAAETGVYFLLCDARSAPLAQDTTRSWLAEILSPLQLMLRASAESRQYWIAASGILPRWHHVIPRASPSRAPLTRLTLAYYDQHPEFQTIADAIALCLNEHGIQLQRKVLSYLEWESGAIEADLWLGTINFHHAIDYAVPAWLFGTPVLRRCLESALPLAQWQSDWRHGRENAASLSAATVRQHWLLPLFHNWQRLQGPGRIADFRLNSMGWFDFKSAWLRPDDN
ncbi:HTH-type transcriptional regulator SgrR [Chromobacterium sp. IIBBL 290-4]|uniref:HTH-type transcriptional regulator SgrR n=1 Tax=Chromobacterium sp. IIBBL 290-4 TaxID=2953890 RepID=UPI0020B7E293|nr:HTH-type transcriptional regulator SgrR [Chromobacterium sp. IIBBL 290-4]UTH74617.1 HTH-type transcriptional regulator SgrR [Chromobacterium sp. IIBBL 290-4]